MTKIGMLSIAVFVAGVHSAAAQTCLHGASERPGDRSQRERALQFAGQINAAESATAGPRVSSKPFRPLAALKLPLAPPGFVLQFQTDGETYSFALKDTLDPCYYAIFSDQDRRIYEAMPKAEGTMIAVATAVRRAPGDLTGDWEMLLLTNFTGAAGKAECTLRQDGHKLTGACSRTDFTGAVEDRRVTFQMPAPISDARSIEVSYTGDLDDTGKMISGTWKAISPPEDLKVKEGSFELRKH